jgi:hypothetical protein
MKQGLLVVWMITASLNTRLTALLTSEGSGGGGLGIPLGRTGAGVDLVSAVDVGSSRLASGGRAQLSERMNTPAATTGANAKSLIQAWFIASSSLRIAS